MANELVPMNHARWEITPTGLQVDGKLTQAEWEELGNHIGMVNRCVMWVVGDWLLAGENAGYLPRGKLAEACAQFGIAYDTSMQAARVCRAFESCMRIQDLTFNHHQLVANHPDAPKLLEWAVKKKASVAELRAEKKRRDAKQRGAISPDPIPDCLPVNSIVRGDNCEVLEVFPDDCIHLVVTSPPYDSLREYGGHAWDFEGVADHLLRVIRPGGVLVWVVADQVVNGGETGTSLRQAVHLQDIGFRLHDTMIYRTNKPPTSGKRYQHCWEYMFVFSNGDPETFNAIREPCTWAGYKTAPTQRDKDGNLLGGNRRIIQDTKVKENIWYYQAGSGKTEKTDHPASFPLQLALDHVKTWSNEGDVVLDPFCGSGTTCRAAADLGRQWIGIEVDSQYAEMARTRLAVERHPLLVEVQDDCRSIA